MVSRLARSPCAPLQSVGRGLLPSCSLHCSSSLSVPAAPPIAALVDLSLFISLGHNLGGHSCRARTSGIGRAAKL